MKKGYLWLFVIIALLYLIGTFAKNEPATESIVFDSPWKSPNSEELLTIGRLMVSKRMTGCGEYHLKKIGYGKYIIACTRDGENWTYYTARPGNEEIELLSNEMGRKLSPPY